MVNMRRTMQCLARYIHAIINSPLYDLGTNVLDEEGIKYQLPGGAFLLRRHTGEFSNTHIMHRLMLNTWVLFYCIPAESLSVFADEYIKVYITERRGWQLHADNPNCYNEIENHLFFYCYPGLGHIRQRYMDGIENIPKRPGADSEYIGKSYTELHYDENSENIPGSGFYLHGETPALLRAQEDHTIPILKRHFQKIAKFASPQDYNALKTRDDDTTHQTSTQLIELVEKLVDNNKHTLSDYGLRQFKSFFESRTPEALGDLLLNADSAEHLRAAKQKFYEQQPSITQATS